ncbi:hypothetical protein [Streptococcus mutans]|uniref:hypothetical protein n=1 Tax=Streptococcus mutans TaxID=1309 RepID=UPI001D11DD12|nr:hypothetical protein [Streptococcus mutans]
MADDVVSSGDVREALVTADNGNTNTDETVGDTVIGEGNDTTDSSSATTDESEVLPSENSVESSLENSDTALGDDSSKEMMYQLRQKLVITTGANSDVTANTSGVSEPNVQSNVQSQILMLLIPVQLKAICHLYLKTVRFHLLQVISSFFRRYFKK